MKPESILARESALLAFAGRYGSLRFATSLSIGGRDVADATIRRGVVLDGSGARLGTATFDGINVTITDDSGNHCLSLDRFGRREGECFLEHPVHRGATWASFLQSGGDSGRPAAAASSRSSVSRRSAAASPRATAEVTSATAGTPLTPSPEPAAPMAPAPMTDARMAAPASSTAMIGMPKRLVVALGVLFVGALGLLFGGKGIRGGATEEVRSTSTTEVARVDAAEPATRAERVEPAAPTAPPIPATIYKFVQQSTANLRVSGAKRAGLIRRVPLATRCELKASTGEWCMVNCEDMAGGPDGFVTCETLGDEQPTVDSVKAQLQTAPDANSRFALYLGLVVLEPTNAEFLEAVRTESANAHFGLLTELRSKPERKPPVRLTVPCGAGDTSCLTAALGVAQNAHVAWRGDDFDATLWIGDSDLKCRVAMGHVDEDAGLVVIEQEQRYTDPPEPFKLAFGPTSGTDPLGDPTTTKPRGPAWIIVARTFPTADSADAYIAEAAAKNFPTLHRLWIPDWASLSGVRQFAVYDGPFAFEDRDVAARRLKSVRKYSQDAYPQRLARDSGQEPLAQSEAEE